MRYINLRPLPSGPDWAALPLDFKAPGPFIRGVRRGHPVAIPTVARAKARNIAHTTQDKNAEARKDVHVGSTGMSQKDVNVAQKDKRADLLALDRPASPSPNFAGVTADGSLHSTSPIPQGSRPQRAPSLMDVDTAVPPSTSTRGGASKGSFVNAFRADHWRGLRHHRESPAPQSYDHPEWKGLREWSDREEKTALRAHKIFCVHLRFFFSLPWGATAKRP